MSVQPVITSLSSPAVAGDTMRAIGTGFGYVSAGYLVSTTDASSTPVNIQVASGQTLQFTVPAAIVDGTYFLLLTTMFGATSINNAGTITLPDTTPDPPPVGSFQADPIPDYTSTAMVAIRARTRLELGDYAENFTAQATGDGEAVRFDLPAEVIDPAQLVVTRTHPGNSPVVLVSSTDYTLDDQEGVVTLAAPLAAGDVLNVSGVNYQFFLDAQLDQIILSAALKHTHGMQDETVYRDITGFKHYDITQRTIDTLGPVEYHPVALLAAVEALWILATDAAFDINVQTAEGTSLAREERYSNIVSLIAVKQEQYDTLAAALGVGLNRIEVYTLRRESRTTGRLVPVYQSKEYDDRSLPVRVYSPVDDGVSGSGTTGVDPYFGGGGVWP